MKKFILGFTLGIFTTIVPATYAAVGLSDISGDEWYADAVISLEALGIITGKSDGAYHASDSLNRAEAAVLTQRTLDFIDMNYSAFPSIDEEVEMGEDIFHVCQSVADNTRIYKESVCGDDSCWSTYYDFAGELLERSDEYGSGTGTDYEPETEAKNCVQTTRYWFNRKIN